MTKDKIINKFFTKKSFFRKRRCIKTGYYLEKDGGLFKIHYFSMGDYRVDRTWEDYRQALKNALDNERQKEKDNNIENLDWDFINEFN